MIKEWELNIYHIRPVNGKGLEQVGNWCQLKDLEIAYHEIESSGEENVGKGPSFNMKVSTE